MRLATVATAAALTLVGAVAVWPAATATTYVATGASQSVVATPTPTPTATFVVYTAADGSTRTCAPTYPGSTLMDCRDDAGAACTTTGPTAVVCKQSGKLGRLDGKCVAGEQSTASGNCVACPTFYTLEDTRCVWRGVAAGTPGVKP